MSIRRNLGRWLTRFAGRRLARALSEIDGIEGLSEERRLYYRAELLRRHAEVFGVSERSS